MTPTLSEIGIAIFLVAVNVALFLWFKSGESAASTIRMKRMMQRAGVDPYIVVRDDPEAKVTLKEARRRCGRCPREGLCERWLCRKAEGDDAFCPNARLFHFLADSGERTA